MGYDDSHNTWEPTSSLKLNEKFLEWKKAHAALSSIEKEATAKRPRGRPRKTVSTPAGTSSAKRERKMDASDGDFQEDKEGQSLVESAKKASRTSPSPVRASRRKSAAELAPSKLELTSIEKAFVVDRKKQVFKFLVRTKDSDVMVELYRDQLIKEGYVHLLLDFYERHIVLLDEKD